MQTCGSSLTPFTGILETRSAMKQFACFQFVHFIVNGWVTLPWRQLNSDCVYYFSRLAICTIIPALDAVDLRLNLDWQLIPVSLVSRLFGENQSSEICHVIKDFFSFTDVWIGEWLLQIISSGDRPTPLNCLTPAVLGWFYFLFTSGGWLEQTEKNKLVHHLDFSSQGICN